jgi:Trk-type K+ transport system membrane component
MPGKNIWNKRAKNGKAEAGAKTKRVEREFERKLISFFAFLLSLWFFFLCFFSILLFEKKKMPKENI